MGVDGDTLRCCSTIHSIPGDSGKWRVVEDMATAAGYPRTRGHVLWTLAACTIGCDYTKGQRGATAKKVLVAVKDLLAACADGEVPTAPGILAALGVDDQETKREIAIAVKASVARAIFLCFLFDFAATRGHPPSLSPTPPHYTYCAATAKRR